MSIAATRVTVTTAATPLATNSGHKLLRFVLKNMTATASVFVGGDNITTGADSFEWETGDSPLEVELEQGETLYGRVASGTQTIHVLQGGL